MRQESEQAARTSQGWDGGLAYDRVRHQDLFLMDIQLPDVSALEVTKWLKGDETLKSLPVSGNPGRGFL